MQKKMAASLANRRLLEELKSMGFPEAKATEALCYLGNSNLEAAIEWLIGPGNDSDINRMMPRVSVDIDVGSPGPDFITEEMKTKARELRDRAVRGRNGERILEARRVAEENEIARYLAMKRAEKEEERRARVRILQKLENDKRERRRKPWSTMSEESPGVRKPPFPVVEEKKNLSLQSAVGNLFGESDRMRECLRSLKRNPKGDDGGSVARAFQTLLRIIGNVAKNPDEEKFRTIRLANPVFQDRVGRFEEGVEFLLICGFEVSEEGEFLHLPRDKVNAGLLNTAGSQLRSASTNPFFSLLNRPN